MAPVHFNTVCFRFNPKGLDSVENLNHINQQLMDNLNDSGKIYLTHTKLNENFVLRMVPGQTEVKQEHVEFAWELIQKHAGQLNLKH